MHFAAASAFRAGQFIGSRLRTGSAAVLALDVLVQADFLLCASDSFLKGDRHPVLHVTASLRSVVALLGEPSACTAAEHAAEHIEDVFKAAKAARTKTAGSAEACVRIDACVTEPVVF